LLVFFKLAPVFRASSSSAAGQQRVRAGTDLPRRAAARIAEPAEAAKSEGFSSEKEGQFDSGPNSVPSELTSLSSE
jgi:hypothetical protein